MLIKKNVISLGKYQFQKYPRVLITVSLDQFQSHDTDYYTVKNPIILQNTVHNYV